MIGLNTPQTMEAAANLITLNGALGEYSLALHFGLIVGMLMVITTAIIGIVKVRGQAMSLAAVCMRDLLFACGCALLVFPFPGAFFFMGRAFWRAFTWRVSEGGQ